MSLRAHAARVIIYAALVVILWIAVHTLIH